MMMTDLIVFSLLGLFAIAQVFLFWHLRGLHARDQQHLQTIERLQADVNALCRAAKGAGEHVSRVEQLLHRLTERHDQLELRTGGDRSYAQAIRTVQHGGKVVDLVDNCGLTRGEAELIVMLHGVDKAS